MLAYFVHKLGVQSQHLKHKLGLVAHTCDSSSFLEMESRGLKGEGHLCLLHSEFKAGLVYMRPVIKQNNMEKEKRNFLSCSFPPSSLFNIYYEIGI